MGDCEFGARAYLNGFRSVSNSRARRIHLKVPEGGLRQMGSWDGMRPTNWLDPRPIPSVLYLYRKYWSNKLALYSIIQTIPISLTPYYLKGKKIGYLLSVIICLIFIPIVFIQVLRSWRISSCMLMEGEKIEAI